MNFDSGNKLADFQQHIFDNFICKNIQVSQQDMNTLTSNYYVKMASSIAPSNLVIRQLCLIDLCHNNKHNLLKILRQLELLCYGSHYVWSEGYSYWLYTKMFLVKYVEKFDEPRIQTIIYAIDDIFVQTSYYRNETLYPIPFGDLRDVPLESSLQLKRPIELCRYGLIFKFGKTYKIEAMPRGLNGHTPNKRIVVNVDENGIPYLENGSKFEFYTGYKDRYPTFFSEWSNLLKLNRILSIINLLF